MYRMMWEYFFPEEEQDSQRRQVSLGFVKPRLNLQISFGKSYNGVYLYRKFGRFLLLLVQGV
jgi:hypothetical protein